MLSQRSPEELNQELEAATYTIKLHKESLDEARRELAKEKHTSLVAKNAAAVKDHVFNVQALALIIAGLSLYQENYATATLGFLAAIFALQNTAAMLNGNHMHILPGKPPQKEVAATLTEESQRSALAQIGNSVIAVGQHMNQYGSLFANNCKKKIEQRIYGETASAAKNKKSM